MTDSDEWAGYPAELEEVRRAAVRYGQVWEHNAVHDRIARLSAEEREYLVGVAAIWGAHAAAHRRWRASRPGPDTSVPTYQLMCLSELLECGGFYDESTRRRGFHGA